MATTTTTKRKFYNAGDAKGFTKAMFFQTVSAMADGDVVNDELIRLVGEAARYEMEGIELRTSEKAPGEKKDPMESDYAKALIAAIVPLLTAEPQSAKELIAAATKAGKLAPTGKEFAGPWVSRVMNALDASGNGVIAMKKVVEKTDAKGLKSQAEVTGYARA